MPENDIRFTPQIDKKWLSVRLLELPELIAQAETDKLDIKARLEMLETYHNKLINEFKALQAISRLF